MASQRGTLELLAEGLAHVVNPLTERLEPGETRYLLAELGLDIPNTSSTQELESAFQSVVHAAELLPGLIEELVSAVDAGQTLEAGVKGALLLQQIAALQGAISAVGTAVAGLTIPSVTAAQLEDFAKGLAPRLVEMMIVEFLQGSAAHGLLSLFGVFETTRANVGEASTQLMEYDRKRLRLGRIATLLTDPEELFRELYRWGEADFDGNALVRRLAAVLNGFGAAVANSMIDGAIPRRVAEISLFSLRPTQDLDPPGLELILMEELSDGVTAVLPFAPGFQFEFEARGRIAGQAGISIQPPATFKVVPPSGEAHGKLITRIAAVPEAPRDDVTLLAIAGVAGLYAKRIAAGPVAGFDWNSSTDEAVGDFGFEGEISGGKLQIGMDDADGFLADLLSGVSLEADFDFGFGWTQGAGVYFKGSGGLSIQLPAHIDLGPVKLSAITISLGIEDGSFPLGISVDLAASLGPMSAVVEQVGVKLLLRIDDDHAGNLGLLDIGGSFKPPIGVGLQLNAGAVNGGGYIRFDPDNGEYAGALELDLAGIVTVKAMVLVNTRMPDGSSGFSMLVVITAEFGNGIQLGFGFVLLGVGGILGLNRTMKLDALVDGVRTGSISNVMFPKNVIANAPRIISDLKAYFPVEQGTFLIGPLAKLGWGTPALVTLTLGVVIEIPGNIAILGVLKVALPDEKAAILVLQVSFIGAIEFDKQRAWFFASLFGSRVLFLTIEGDMGLLIGFGKNPNFVITVGGFHPSYQAPPMPFPVPRRVAVMILNESWGRIRVDGYFAVTSNTAQFGSGIEVYFGFSGFSIRGGLRFDALFQFSPFYFIVQISGSLSLKAAGVSLLTVRLKFTLEGTSPWRAKGRGKVKLLFFSISANFDVSWGKKKNTQLPPIDVMPLLEAEFNKLENWVPTLPANSQGVTLRPIEATDGLVLHPVGTLRISQRSVPLDIDIDKVGSRSARDAKRFSIGDSGGDFACTSDALEMFAIGQFQDLGTGAALSRKDFELETSGCLMAPEGSSLGLSGAATRRVRYELSIIDDHHTRSPSSFFVIFAGFFSFLLGGNSAAKSELSEAKAKLTQPFAEMVEVGLGEFTVAFSESNTQYSSESSFNSEAQAHAFLADTVQADPSLANSIHVIESFEVQEAA